MFDIEFFMKAHELKKSLMAGQKKPISEVLESLESFRSREPIIYNIETTNACNMKCEMCPRTTMMTRSVDTIDLETFKSVISQIRPFSESQLARWAEFVEMNYGIKRDEMSENHFYLHIIPTVIQLHGYGDPLLDKNISLYVKMLSDKGFRTYFSCNPSNINIEKMLEIFKSGLTYIKYSIESTDDDRHRQIRGEASDFTQSYKKIIDLLELKEKKALKTKIVITMLNLNKSWQMEEFEKLRKAFERLDVYVYLKSEDTMWYRKDYHCSKSIHWTEFCQHPWMSMTIKSNGEAVMCMEDFDNEIVLGDAKEEPLYDIWNGEKYRLFRKQHFDLTGRIRCTERCDMKLVGEFLLKDTV
ncbi:MAG: radical SAM/SPASM domain-containing protein [Candidatus Omnitrophica bacterium]|nr:radical SAM/SPASM domain-containing protein [Candidatus Omnitrophota bacterium]